MIQLTRTEQGLTGTLDQVSIADEAAATVKSSHLAFTGVVQDTAITLTFPGGLGTVTNIAGTLSTDTMTLQHPQDDGSVMTIELRPGSVDDYNTAVANLRELADANSARQAQAVADEQAADQVRRRQADITAAADTVISGTTALRSALAEPPSFSAFAQHLDEAKDNLADTKKHAAAAGRQSDPYDACNAAYEAQNAAYDVANNAYDIDNDRGDLDIAISSVVDEATKLEDDLAAYRDAAAGLAGFSAPHVPDTSDTAAVLKTATTRTAAWAAKGKSYRGEVAALVKKAEQVARTAQNRYC